jgi:hypothetical protein
VLSAYLNAVSPTNNPEAEKPIVEMYTEEQIEAMEAPSTPEETPEPELSLPPTNYEREWIHIYHSSIKSVKAPSKPTKEVSGEPEKVVDENALLDPNWIPLPEIAKLNDSLYSLEVLRKIQEEEEKATRDNPNRKSDLEEELKRIKKEQCKVSGEQLRPADFPIELWQYVKDDQKPLVSTDLHYSHQM